MRIGFFELCLIVTSMRFVFRVPIHGSVLLLAFLSLPYLFVSLSLGILISSKANSQGEAMQMAFLTILPSIFFSGYIFPRETMPLVFRVLSYFVPASYFINITRGIILRGALFSIYGSTGWLFSPWARSCLSWLRDASATKSSWPRANIGLPC